MAPQRRGLCKVGTTLLFDADPRNAGGEHQVDGVGGDAQEVVRHLRVVCTLFDEVLELLHDVDVTGVVVDLLNGFQETAWTSCVLEGIHIPSSGVNDHGCTFEAERYRFVVALFVERPCPHAEEGDLVVDDAAHRVARGAVMQAACLQRDAAKEPQ